MEFYVVITGGTSGIGKGLAARFHAAGAKVLITARSATRLQAMADEFPGIMVKQSDLASSEDRSKLAEYIKSEFQQVNVFINNGGIQRRIALASDHAAWNERQKEIDILLSAPVHLNSLITPHLLCSPGQKLIVNVTSGGAYIPQPFAPVYAACKAALHSYTVTLRHSVQNTPVRVMELIPPAVATRLAGQAHPHGVPLDDFCDAVFPRICSAKQNSVGYGLTDTKDFIQAASKSEEQFAKFANRFDVLGYAGSNIGVDM